MKGKYFRIFIVRTCYYLIPLKIFGMVFIVKRTSLKFSETLHFEISPRFFMKIKLPLGVPLGILFGVLDILIMPGKILSFFIECRAHTKSVKSSGK